MLSFGPLKLRLKGEADWRIADSPSTTSKFKVTSVYPLQFDGLIALLIILLIILLIVMLIAWLIGRLQMEVSRDTFSCLWWNKSADAMT